MPRTGLDTETVVAAAAALADAEGLEAVTLARLAAALDVRSPSLYVHVDGLAGPAAAARAPAPRASSPRLLGAAAAGRSGADALAAVAERLPRYAREHPGTYAAAQRTRNLADPDASEAAAAVLDTVFAVLRGYDVR